MKCYVCYVMSCYVKPLDYYCTNGDACEVHDEYYAYMTHMRTVT